MKDRRVLRGQTTTVQYDGALNLIVDDGNFNDAWRVTKFLISYNYPHDSSAGSRDCVGVLATHQDALLHPLLPTVIQWNWEDRRQIAWTSQAWEGDTTVGHWDRGVIDPQHVIVRDLWIGITSALATSTTVFNYMVELERVVLNDNQSVMALIQETGQGDF